jgi:large subunit ribosomal protein L13
VICKFAVFKEEEVLGSMVAKNGSATKTKLEAKTGAKATTAQKAPAKRLQKKAAKSKASALKQASKTKVRLSRETLRAEKKSESTKGRKPTRGQAPHSARISPVKGPVAPLASRTAFAPLENTERKWLVIDASGQTVGRLATEIAMILRGKHKATFTPNNDVGDFVVVINAEQVKFSAAAKEENKNYYKHSGYIGGMKITTPRQLREKNHAERILFHAVKGMVPRNPLGRRQMLKLKIYTGAQHPHTAQQPVMWKLRTPSLAK